MRTDGFSGKSANAVTGHELGWLEPSEILTCRALLQKKIRKDRSIREAWTRPCPALELIARPVSTTEVERTAVISWPHSELVPRVGRFGTGTVSPDPRRTHGALSTVGQSML